MPPLSLLIPLLLLIVAIPLVVAIMRANELFCLRVRGREVRVVRGRVPQRLLDDVVDVVRQTRVGDVTLRAVIEDRVARWYVEGEIAPEQRQRLRNVLSQWPIAKIRHAPRPR